MRPLRVVGFDRLRDRSPRLLGRRETAVKGELQLENPVHPLGSPVFIAVPLLRHARLEAKNLQDSAIPPTGVLAAPIRMLDDRRPTRHDPHRHLQRGDRARGRQVGGKTPADDVAAESVRDKRQVGEAVPDPDVRDVRNVHLIRSVHNQPPCQVRRDRKAGVASRRLRNERSPSLDEHPVPPQHVEEAVPADPDPGLAEPCPGQEERLAPAKKRQVDPHLVHNPDNGLLVHGPLRSPLHVVVIGDTRFPESPADRPDEAGLRTMRLRSLCLGVLDRQPRDSVPAFFLSSSTLMPMMLEAT